MVWSPRVVPRFWVLPTNVVEPFLGRRFSETVANAGDVADTVFQVLIPTAGFFDDMETAQAAVSFALDRGLLSAADAVVAEAEALGYAERPAAQVRTLRRWLDGAPAPANWLRAAWSAHRCGFRLHALGYASVGLRLAAGDPHADEAVLVDLAATRAAVHAGHRNIAVRDLLLDPPVERLDAQARALIAELFVSDVPPLPCDDRPGLDDEAYRRALRVVLDGGDLPPGTVSAGGMVAAGFFPLREYYAARPRWYDLIDSDASDYLRTFATDLHYLVAAGYAVTVVPLSVDDLERWMAERGIAEPRRWVRDQYALYHADRGRPWTGDQDALCWCGMARPAASCTHTVPGVTPPRPLRPARQPVTADDARLLTAFTEWYDAVREWMNSETPGAGNAERPVHQ